MALRDPDNDATGTAMSMIGLAIKPGTEVLPTCSIGATSHGLRISANSACSFEKINGQDGS